MYQIHVKLEILLSGEKKRPFGCDYFLRFSSTNMDKFRKYVLHILIPWGQFCIVKYAVVLDKRGLKTVEFVILSLHTPFQVFPFAPCQWSRFEHNGIWLMVSVLQLYSIVFVCLFFSIVAIANPIGETMEL